ncbi:ATP-binding protein [Celerinatantimonas sp. YJH-8]|uniref:sensor histidine kinase n=1 Tax=Celerinatantimonas sp. YJH-8 TaxID=3228714 RepID=UPI0038C51DA3
MSGRELPTSPHLYHIQTYEFGYPSGKMKLSSAYWSKLHLARKRWSFRDSRLARRLVMAIVLFSSLLTVTFTGAQLYLQYRLDLQNVDQSAQIIRDSWLASLTESIWDYDTDLIEMQLNGMINLPFIMQIQLKLSDGQYFAVGHPSADDTLLFKFPLQHVQAGKMHALGALTVVADTARIHQDLIRYALTILVSNLIKAALVVIFMLFIFQLLLGQHLIQIVAYLTGSDGHDPRQPMRLHRHGKDRDELDDLVNAYNDMSQRLTEENQRRLEESEQRSAMQQQLARMDRQVTMGEMATSLAHELNQPLASITGYADICRRFLSQQEMAKLDRTLEKISNEALRASEIIRRTREFVRSRKTARENIRVYDLLETTLAIIQHSADQVNVELRLEVDATADEVVYIDKIQIQQVLINLLKNAMDALVSLPEPRLIRVRAVMEQERVRIQVIDNGSGIDPQVMETLFSPFVTTKDDGMGIGLAISRAIVEAHHGQLRADNQPDGGACFELDLAISCE